MIYAVCALALLGSQSSQAATDAVLATYKIADREVVAKVPATKLSLPACTGYKDGDWTYLFDSSGKLTGRIGYGGGWDEASSLHAAAKAKSDEKTPAWKVKAVVLTRFDILEKSNEGALMQRRSTLENSQVVASLEALAKFASLADAYGQGRFRLTLDVSIENEGMRFGPTSGIKPFDATFCENYFGPRINGGDYEAEDKVFRGPYDSVLFIHAGWTEDGEPNAVVNGAPVGGVAFAPKDDMSSGQDLGLKLLNKWCGQIPLSLSQRGIAVSPFVRFGLAADGSLLSEGSSLLATAAMSGASIRSGVSTSDLLARLKVQKAQEPKPWSEVADNPLAKLPMISNPVVGSQDLVQVVNINGKTVLIANADVADFVARNLKSGYDAKAIGWLQARSVNESGPIYIAFSLSADPGQATNRELLDLKSEPVSLGAESVKDIPSLGPWANEKETPAFTYSLSPSTDPTSTEAKIAKAAALNENSSQADRDEVVAMLASRDDALKLNAAQVFTRVKEPSAVKPLIDLLPGFNLRVVEIALRALNNQEGDQASQAVRRSLVNGRYGYVQAIAAELTAQKNNPKDAQHIATLLASDSWLAWLYGANAISQYDDQIAQTFLMTFLWKTDPAVRLAATKGSRPKYDMPSKRLLWSAINDPSDLVRAEACIKLIKSDSQANRDEGYKGIRDDSILVRKILLDFMAKNPSVSHRKALQIALADTDAEVRAMALAASKTLPGDITMEEIQNTLNDQDPRVQNALVELAISRKLKLPADAAAALRSSLDPQVAQRAKELAE